MDEPNTRREALANLVHRAATSDIEHDLDSLCDALPHVSVEELAEAFADAKRRHPDDAPDLSGLCDRIAAIAMECCRGQEGIAVTVITSDPTLDAAVAGVTRVLAGVYLDVRAPEERARNIVAGLIGDPHPDAWAGILYSLPLREFAVPLPQAALESLALRVLAAFVAATRPADDQLTKVGHLTRYGVPARWAVCSAELVSPALTGAA